MAKILGIGNTVLDIILTVTHPPKEDQEIRATRKHIQSGGNINNMLYVLNQLGHQTDLCTTVAADSEAKILLKNVAHRGIGTEHVQTFIKGQTPTSYIHLNAQNGSRTIVHYRDLPEVNFEQFAKIEIEEYDWIHFEGRNMDNLPGMINIAKTFLTHQPISLEVEKPREGIESIFSQANLIIFSHHYASAKGFPDGQTLLESLDLPNTDLVCTWGARGAWFKEKNGPIKHQVAVKINQAIDTLGAGDTFNASLIHKFYETSSLSKSVAFACELAAKKCQQQGLDGLLKPTSKQQPIANIKHLSAEKTTVVQTEDLKSYVLIKYNDEIRCYLNNCPHQNVHLNEAYKIDVNPFEKTIKCSVHDAWFNIEDGECIKGPCWKETLESVALTLGDNGDIYLKE